MQYYDENSFDLRCGFLFYFGINRGITGLTDHISYLVTKINSVGPFECREIFKWAFLLNIPIKQINLLVILPILKLRKPLSKKSA